MAFAITRPGKYSLTLETPVMPAAGVFGFGDAYRSLIDLEKLGAIVTNPVTLHHRSPVGGIRAVALDAGALIHTGLPNPGLRKVIEKYRRTWNKMPAPIILHLAGTSVDEIRHAAEIIDQEPAIAAVELGLDDDLSIQEAQQLVRAGAESFEKPLLARLPLHNAIEIAPVIADTGADALVIAAPPRGTARDPFSGRLVSGRIYGPLMKPPVLRLVGVLSRQLSDVPIIGAGGIHSPADARDYLEAGAVAVQVDAVVWAQPSMLARIAHDLGGWILTREHEAFPDEWHPGMGDTEKAAISRARVMPAQTDDRG